jgi:ribosome-associated translation inhibitor RaiA
MSLVPRITFHNLDPSPAVESDVRQRVARLERRFHRLTRCHVVVEAPHHHAGRRYEVQIILSVPGGELVVARGADANADHRDVRIAVRDAFHAARRMVEEYSRRLWDRAGEAREQRAG